MNKIRGNKPEIQEDIFNSWQRIVDMMAKISDVPAVLIMKAEPPFLEVFISSQSQDNPYNPGDKEKMSGLYCEHVIKTGEKLNIANALKDENWKDNLGIDLGMISYLGIPIYWPDGDIFGTICILDTKERNYSQEIIDLIEKFKELIESHLKRIIQEEDFINIRKNLNERIKELSCLFKVSELLLNKEIGLENILKQIAELLPDYFQFPDKTKAFIKYKSEKYPQENYNLADNSLYSEKIPVASDRDAKIIISFANNNNQKIDILAEEKTLIKAVASQVANLIEIKEKENTINQAKKRLDREIQKAKKLHEKSLPTNISSVDGLNIYAFYQPATEIGGDFYNFIKINNNKLLFYLIDITGHGLDAALMSSFVKNTINTYVKLIPADKKVSPKEIIEFLYKQNQSENFPEDYFITILLGVIDSQDKTLVYCSAGLHIPPMIFDNKIKELPAGKLPISRIIREDLVEYNNIEVKLKETSTLFFSTDGLFEQPQFEHKQSENIYGDRYKEIIYKNKNLPPGAIAQQINREFADFSKGKLNDDITYALIQLKPDEKYPELNFSINSSKAEVDRAKRKVAEFIKSENQTIRVDEIIIAIHEMLINALEHGNKFDESKKIKIELKLKDQFIQLSVEDEGEGFNWMQVKAEKSGTILDIQDEVAALGRGLGFMIARTISDYFYYNYEGNKVTFIKKHQTPD